MTRPTTTYQRRSLATATAATLLVLTQLSGCAAPIIIGGAAATALVVTDRRSAGDQVDDKAINVKVDIEASKLLGDRLGRVSGSSYAGQVLLVGDVPSEADSQRIAATVKQIDKVKDVINRLRVAPVTELSVRTNDSWITTKVTTALINTKGVPSRTISVTTERGVVYLQGFVTKTEGDLAARAASTVPGVAEVVKLFEYVSGEKGLLPPASNVPAAGSTPAPVQGIDKNQPETFAID